MQILKSQWWRPKLALLMFAAGAALAACGGSSSSGSSSPIGYSGDAACNDATSYSATSAAAPVSNVSTNRSLVKAAAVTAAAVPANTVRVHYHRADGAYSTWLIWAWSGSNNLVAGSFPGTTGPTGTDSYGAYYDLSSAKVSGGAIGFLFVTAGGTKDISNTDSKENRLGTIPGGDEVWAWDTDNTLYATNPLGAIPSFTTVRVHYKRYDGGYANWGLHLWSSNGMDVTQLPNGFPAIGDWNNPVPLSSMPNYATDNFGVLFTIPVLDPSLVANSAITNLQFIIHNLTNTGNKDGWTNNITVDYHSVVVNGGVADVWLQQQDTTVYYTGAPVFSHLSSTDATAYWLTKSLIQWPRADNSVNGVFKLYYSAKGTVAVSQGKPVTGATGSITLLANNPTVPQGAATRFAYLVPGIVLQVNPSDAAALQGYMADQLVLVQEDSNGNTLNATTAQTPGYLDDQYSAASSSTLGVTYNAGVPSFAVWAPTAQNVALCVYTKGGKGGAGKAYAMTMDPTTGIWSATGTAGMDKLYYKYAVDVFARTTGKVLHNVVTDPYSISLSTNGFRSYIADLANDATLQPTNWGTDATPNANILQSDMSVYELHVREFSKDDATVPSAHRGKFLAFADSTSNGMKHLAELAQNGLTDVHIMPAYDFSSVNEAGCSTPNITNTGAADQGEQTAAIAGQGTDCWNWGYDPQHYGAPEGSYSSDASDGAVRVKEFRAMVQGLHTAGLRVTMDVVYNHTPSSGQADPKEVFDHIVPDYYHRLDATGVVQNGTGAGADTAAENMMMGKLVQDTVAQWSKQYHVDDYRFDLMAFLPLSVIQATKTAASTAAGHPVYIFGEGWNFAEVANNALFVQASQLSTAGSGIATFSDRARDAIRGGTPFDSGNQYVDNQGFVNGESYDDNEGCTLRSTCLTATNLLANSDMIRVGLAGSVNNYPLTNYLGASVTLSGVLYGGAPGGYVNDPSEVVNYMEVHDNQTLFDINAYKMPLSTSADDRARAQALAMALNGMSQGIAYFYSGVETMRSKDFDNNSYDSGDWFNKLDWTFQTNNYGVGLPVGNTNGQSGNWPVMTPFLTAPTLGNIKPDATHIGYTKQYFDDVLAIRHSSKIFRMATGADVIARLTFYNTGATQTPGVVMEDLNGADLGSGVYDPNAAFTEAVVAVNVTKTAQDIVVPALANKSFVLHPVLVARTGAYLAWTQTGAATYTAGTGTFHIPPRTTVVWVQ